MFTILFPEVDTTPASRPPVTYAAIAPCMGPPGKIVRFNWHGRLDVVERDSRGSLCVVSVRLPYAPRMRMSESQTAGSTATSPVVRADLAAIARQVVELQSLPHGWDGDDAPAPSPVAISRAIEIVGLVPRLPDEVDPDAVGGVALWFYGDGNTAMVGVRNSGLVTVCTYRQGTSVPEVSVVLDAVSAADLVTRGLARS
jgi:hypothetical protein